MPGLQVKRFPCQRSASGFVDLCCLPYRQPAAARNAGDALPGRFARFDRQVLRWRFYPCLPLLACRSLTLLDSQIALLKARVDRAAEPNLDPHIAAAKAGAYICAPDSVDLSPEAKRVVAGHLPGLHHTQDRIQIESLVQRPVGVGRIGGRHHQMLIPPGHKLFVEVSIGLFEGRRSRDAQALDQPVLRRLKLRSTRPWPEANVPQSNRPSSRLARSVLAATPDGRQPPSRSEAPSPPSETGSPCRCKKPRADRAAPDRSGYAHVLFGGIVAYEAGCQLAGRVVDHVDRAESSRLGPPASRECWCPTESVLHDNCGALPPLMYSIDCPLARHRPAV